MDSPAHPGLEAALHFPLVAALLGRRSRRFFLGAEIPDGPLAFRSAKAALPLSEAEQMLVLLAVAGNTGWHYAIPRHERYSPHLPNYAAAAGGRTLPSAAGFHTSEVFFTNDQGVFFLATRDAPALAGPDAEGRLDLHALLSAHRGRIRRLAPGRLRLPPREPHVEGHNTWVVNGPGTLLIIPAADCAQHHIANLCYYLQNGYALYDDISGERIAGLKPFSRLFDPDNLLPLSLVERYTLMEATTELACACQNGVLILQAMGLGGWLFNGVNPYSVLGASNEPGAEGLGFRYDTDARWALPNPTGLPGVFEGCCPPHQPSIRAAVEAVARRKFGPGGPFHPDTPGAWRKTPAVRGSAQVHSEEFKECVTVMAEHIWRRYGKLPALSPTILVHTYLQAHHLDLEFYDHHFRPGAYLSTHARHMELWHKEE